MLAAQDDNATGDRLRQGGHLLVPIRKGNPGGAGDRGQLQLSGHQASRFERARFELVMRISWAGVRVDSLLRTQSRVPMPRSVSNRLCGFDAGQECKTVQLKFPTLVKPLCL